MDHSKRPLSPHISIYYWKVTMLSSLLHRASGIALVLGSILLVVWIACAAIGPDAFASVNAVYSSWFGLILMFGWSLALYYHLCNGIRHLVCDTGQGFTIPVAERTSYIAIIAAVVLTILSWVIGLAI